MKFYINSDPEEIEILPEEIPCPACGNYGCENKACNDILTYKQ